MQRQRIGSIALAALLIGTAGNAAAQAANTTVYRCPGPPVLYTDTLTPAEAKERNCRTIENAPVTVIQGAPPRTVKLPAPVAASGPRPAGERVDPADQRARDGESRRILEGELKREEARLAELKAEYKNGEPDRLGSERNYQRYLDRVAEMKEGIARKEADVAAIRRELAKLAPASAAAGPGAAPAAVPAPAAPAPAAVPAPAAAAPPTTPAPAQ